MRELMENQVKTNYVWLNARASAEYVSQLVSSLTDQEMLELYDKCRTAYHEAMRDDY